MEIPWNLECVGLKSRNAFPLQNHSQSCQGFPEPDTLGNYHIICHRRCLPSSTPRRPISIAYILFGFSFSLVSLIYLSKLWLRTMISWISLTHYEHQIPKFQILLVLYLEEPWVKICILTKMRACQFLKLSLHAHHSLQVCQFPKSLLKWLWELTIFINPVTHRYLLSTLHSWN